MNYVIWSEQHCAWLLPEKGYTNSLRIAGRYPKEEAEAIVAKANAYQPTFPDVALPDPFAK
jgi:hypothetical protein